MKALGIDIGSLTTKAVILDDDGILASSIITSGDEAELSAKGALELAPSWKLIKSDLIILYVSILRASLIRMIS